jgi:hypothetical protein
MGFHQIVRHLRQLGFEVGQAGDAGGQVVLAAGALGLDAEPAADLRILQIDRVIPGVIIDHVQQHLDAAGVGLVHQRLKIGLAAEARIGAVEVVRPVAVVAPVRKAGAGDEAVDVLHHRGDPEGRHPQAGDLVELLGEPP